MTAPVGIEGRIRGRLIEVARAQALIPYGEIAPMAGLDMGNPDHRRQLGTILGRISSYEHEQGRPMLSAVVVHRGGSEPGNGFFECATDLGLFGGRTAEQKMEFFARELRRLYDHWSRPGQAQSSS